MEETSNIDILATALFAKLALPHIDINEIMNDEQFLIIKNFPSSTQLEMLVDFVTKKLLMCTEIDHLRNHLISREKNIDLADLGIDSLPENVDDEAISEIIILNVSRNDLYEIPGFNFTSLRRLILSGNKITKLPEKIFNLPNLEYLDISDNSLDYVGTVAAQNIQELNLNNNNLISLSFDVLPALKSVKLSNNKILEFPFELAHCPLIEYIDISKNDIKEISTIPSFPNLKYLDVSNNKLISVPTFTILPVLSHLDFSSQNFSQSSFILSNYLPSLKTLMLNKCNLHDWPDIAQCVSITYVDLSNNFLYDVPPWLTLLVKMKTLKLSGNKFRSIPPLISRMAELRSLDFDNNPITELGQNLFRRYSTITHVNISSLRLERLPASFEAMTTMESLCLDDNNFEFIPKCVYYLGNLKHLSIKRNSLITVPAAIKHLKALRHLDLRYNSLMHLHEDLCKCENLRYLLLEDNQLKILPESMNQLKLLECLNISSNEIHLFPYLEGMRFFRIVEASCNRINKIPTYLGEMCDLSVIDLSNNYFDTFPEVLCKIKNLKILRFKQYSGKKIVSIPSSIGNLKRLSDLDLSGNKLSFLPKDIKNLKELVILKANDNVIRAIPEDISNLTKLRVLELENNILEKLPYSLICLKSLNNIKVDNNPLKVPPLLFMNGDFRTCLKLHFEWEQSVLHQMAETVNTSLKLTESDYKKILSSMSFDNQNILSTILSSMFSNAELKMVFTSLVKFWHLYNGSQSSPEKFLTLMELQTNTDEIKKLREILFTNTRLIM